MSSYNRNFDDAFGLIGRMLGSRDSSALWALGLEAARIAIRPIDWLLGFGERRALADSAGSTGPMLLIVGVPRSGTTLAYQLLSRTLDVSHFTNATGLFFHAPVKGTALGAGFASKSRGEFRSYYGNSSGLRAPNDGFGVWNRWLGDDRYRAPGELDDATQRRMRSFFAAWHARHRKPFLNKNNRNSDCLTLLADILPEARFLEIRRDELAVAESLLRARRTIQGTENSAWGLGSKDSRVQADDAEEEVCRQIALVRNRLDAHSAPIDESRFMRYDYETLCENPGAFVQAVTTRFTEFSVHPDVRIESLKPFEISRAANTAETARLRKLMDRAMADPTLDEEMP